MSFIGPSACACPVINLSFEIGLAIIKTRVAGEIPICSCRSSSLELALPRDQVDLAFLSTLGKDILPKQDELMSK